MGKQVDSEIFTQNGIAVDTKGIPNFKTNVEGVYVGGDAMDYATVVEGIADAQAFANAVIGKAHTFAISADAVAAGRRPSPRRASSPSPPSARATGA